MATLVLTAVGAVVGGPIGALVGAAIGQQVDQRLFAPKGRQGPRLGDLSVQVSRYGQPLPKLFGTMRVAGTVIWATDLIEASHKSGGGKGAPKTTTYSYSASFAVALSARPVRAVHRIWADGKLLRGAAGDWKAQTGFRLYNGDEDQPLDPAIAAAEGINNTPAYRGIAYAVFEHLELADFANHIPSLTFEVEADDGPVSIGEIAHALSDGGIAGVAALTFEGFAASGDSVRAVIEVLARAQGLSLSDEGNTLRFADPEATPVAIEASALGASADGQRWPRVETERLASGALPDEMTLSYYEPERDYLAGLQRARRGGPGRRSEQMEVAAALNADTAKAIAEQRLAEAWSERTRRTVRLPWRALDLSPGDRLTLRDVPGEWRIAALNFEKMAIEAKLVGVATQSAILPPAAPGRATGAADAEHGPTVLHILDLPPLDDAPRAAPRLWIAAAGSLPGWRRAALIASLDGGLSYRELGSTAAPATMGVTLSALSAGSAWLFDDDQYLEIELLHEHMSLEGCSDDMLIGGANLALIGDELIQFGRVEQIGAITYRISRLLRGRRGSEWAMAGHVEGERFVLLTPDSVLAYDLPLGSLGVTIGVTASGIGDPVGVDAATVVTGRALRPPAPVQIKAERLADSTVRINWARRSRAGWAWLDGDTPLGEESERYRLEIVPSVGTMRSVESVMPHYDYGPEMQDTDGSTGAASLSLSISQIGSIASTSPPASILIEL